MTQKRWHILRETDRYTLARHLPVRLDVQGQSVFPSGVRADRLALQIRQDLWRLLRGLRGFSPVIQVTWENRGDLLVTAGGRVMQPAPKETSKKIQALLDSRAHRARWLSWAQERAA